MLVLLVGTLFLSRSLKPSSSSSHVSRYIGRGCKPHWIPGKKELFCNNKDHTVRCLFIPGCWKLFWSISQKLSRDWGDYQRIKTALFQRQPYRINWIRGENELIFSYLPKYLNGSKIFSENWLPLILKILKQQNSNVTQTVHIIISHQLHPFILIRYAVCKYASMKYAGNPEMQGPDGLILLGSRLYASTILAEILLTNIIMRFLDFRF